MSLLDRSAKNKSWVGALRELLDNPTAMLLGALGGVVAIELLRSITSAVWLGYLSIVGLTFALITAARLYLANSSRQNMPLNGPNAPDAASDPEPAADLLPYGEGEFCPLRPPGIESRSLEGAPSLLPGYKCISMLEILYDVAASINVTRDVNEVLMRFLHTLTEILDAKAGAVRLLGDDNEMHLVASVGLDEDIMARELVLPAKTCLCGQTEANESVLYQRDLRSCAVLNGRPMFADEASSLIAVPLRYGGRTLGVYNLFVAKQHFELYKDFEELFTCIGRYLGMAIEKARLDEESNRLTILDERARLSHELHDSLAQTLASVRFQVRVLDETLHQGNEASMWALLEQIENSLDEANYELRELISHFRAPLDKQGVVPAVERAVERFRRECDIPIYLQKEWPQQRLPADYEMHIIRIVQEALANIRKHSAANAVRVMLHGSKTGAYKVLVEDDGVGIKDAVKGGVNPGDHIGLSIMRDRARRIGGTLTIESEPSEGTQIVLEFNAPKVLNLAGDTPTARAVAV
ncbi:MAG: ATP-binding protein [Thiotrichales bacterium]